jgi:hypothetical protein
MNDRQFAALLGFAFAAAWIGFNFGYALLCLVGAGAFYLLAGVVAGSVDLGELQERITGRSSDMSRADSRVR